MALVVQHQDNLCSTEAVSETEMNSNRAWLEKKKNTKKSVWGWKDYLWSRDNEGKKDMKLHSSAKIKDSCWCFTLPMKSACCQVCSVCYPWQAKWENTTATKLICHMRRRMWTKLCNKRPHGSLTVPLECICIVSQKHFRHPSSTVDLPVWRCRASIARLVDLSVERLKRWVVVWRIGGRMGALRTQREMVLVDTAVRV